MPFRLIPSFLFYCLIGGISPGPANLCSLSASLNYGKKQALKQWRGLFTGFSIVAFVSVLVCYFLGNVMGTYVKYLSYVGAVYLLWMAWHILRSGSSEDMDAAKNCNFFTGLTVQLTNVKIMVFCMTALSSFVLPYTHSFWKLLAVGIFLPFTGPVCNLAWLFAGVQLQGIFQKHRRMINLIMAVSLILCAISLIRS